MKIVMALLSLFVFFKTFYYGIYEFKQNNNKVAGSSLMLLSIVCLVAANLLVHLRINLSS